jgi:DNA-binding protein HU-beta
LRSRFVNKTDLVDQVAARTGQTKVAVAAAIEAAMDIIVEAVAHSESVTLSGFGTFEPRDRKARTGRNPRTGDAVPIPARTVPSFRPGNSFKSAVE